MQFGFTKIILFDTNNAEIASFINDRKGRNGEHFEKKIVLSKSLLTRIKGMIKIRVETPYSSYSSCNTFGESDFQSINNLETKLIPKPTAPANLSISNITFNDSLGNNNNILDGNENAKITFILSNKGKGDAYNLVAEISEENKLKGLEYPKEQIIGNLASGKEITISIPISGTMQLDSGKASFTISINEANNFNADPFKISIPTQEFKHPKVSIIDYKFTANEEGKIKLGESVTLNLIIQNKGQGIASDVKISFINPSNIFPAGDTSFSIIKLKPNENNAISYEFFANKKYEGNEIPLQIKIAESYGKYGETKTLSVSLDKTLAKTQQIDINGVYDKQIQIDNVSLTSDVDDNLPKTKNKNPNAFAVIIGNRNYVNTIKVDYAINDVKSIKHYLINVLGYKEGNISYIEDATKSTFETYFGGKDNPYGKLYNYIKPDSTSDVFIYYSGHGAPGLKDNKGYFVPVDCDPQYVEQGGYSLNLFYSNLAKLPAKSITVLTDACFSGADIIKNISSIKIKVSDTIATIKNCVILSSSTSSQVSSWYPEKQHGMFTYFFLKALQDKEKSDKNKDNKLTYQEIFDYISDKTEGIPYYARSINGVEQTPCLQGTGKDNVFIEYK